MAQLSTLGGIERITLFTLMSWHTGVSIFWELWPKVKAAIPNPEHRADFARGQLRLFLDYDVDHADLYGQDPEIDRLIEEIDP